MPLDSSAAHDRAHAGDIRVDFRLIADMVDPGSRVLDIGCGEGDLLEILWRQKNVDGRGIELSQGGVHACVSRGLSVIQGDADTDLSHYPANAFDYVILSQTLQAMHDPRGVLDNLCRIGQRAIVSFPNFGYWRVRLSLLWRGRMPVNRKLPYAWYETPNIHFCTITDFAALCRSMGIVIERTVIVRGNGAAAPTVPGAFANWTGEQGLFLLRRSGDIVQDGDTAQNVP